MEGSIQRGEGGEKKDKNPNKTAIFEGVFGRKKQVVFVVKKGTKNPRYPCLSGA
jgi:hypothetical protein